MRTVFFLAALIVGTNPAYGQNSEKEFDWTIGTWEGVRRDAGDGTGNPMIMTVERILDEGGQTRNIEILHEKGIYRGFAVQVYNARSGTWSRLYTNAGRGTFSELEGRAGKDSSVWVGISPGRKRESRLLSERPSPDLWRRTMSVSEDGGRSWKPIWIDELRKTKGSAPNEDLVKQFMMAFNNHDAEAMAAFVADEVRWLSLMKDTVVVEVQGRDNLVESMVGYFKSVPSVRSEIESSMSSGSFVSIRERAFWRTDDEERSQASLAVYEITEGKVNRVWYFPAEK